MWRTNVTFQGENFIKNKTFIGDSCGGNYSLSALDSAAPSQWSENCSTIHDFLLDVAGSEN